MDYKELVAAIRHCFTAGKTCRGCPLDECPGEGVWEWAMIALTKQAADALEELQQDNADLNGTVANLIEQIRFISDYRWISVTERLPEADGSFITAYSKGGVSQNWYITFHHGGGKWYQNSEDTGEVTHWMPLPEPPKEEV